MAKQMNVARVLAFAAGDKFYFTGEKCKRGHLAKRRIDTAICTQCKREYDLRWEADNPDKLRAINQRGAAKYHSKQLKAQRCAPDALEIAPPRKSSRQQRSI
jgi:hypothetical protein